MSFKTFIMLFFVVTLPAVHAWPNDVPSVTEIPVSAEVDTGLDYLLARVGANSSGDFDIRSIEPVMAFIQSVKSPSARYHMKNKPDMSSVFYQFDVRSNLRRILDVGYHPDIPSFILSPSSVRLSYWKSIDGKQQPLPRLSENLSGLDNNSIMVKGVEHEEITPDQFTGTYYAYELDRTLILTRYNGRNMLISIARQENLSEVGKKGLVVGKDENWNYLYSNDKGLNKPGLGWVSSYMYGANSVMILEEIDSKKPWVRCSMFKWLRAGWSGINIVQNHHIYSGMERFGTTFQKIMDNPSLPSHDEMVDVFVRIQNLTRDELQNKTQLYFSQLLEKYGRDSSEAGKFITGLMKNNTYLSQMTVAQMRSILELEYIKLIMGKTRIINISDVIPVSSEKGVG